jgi:hypothetical protein
MRTYCLLLITSLLAPCLAGQDGPQAAALKELAPRPVSFAKPALPLADAMTALTAQTGNALADQRRQKSNPTIQLPAGPIGFWPALDAVGKTSGIGFSPYALDGGVALVDTPYRAVPVAYAGLFRVAERRVAVSRDAETLAHHCHVALDVAWEPRFRPFYVDVRQVKVTYAPDAENKALTEEVPARGPVSAAGRAAIEVDLQAHAPHRSCSKITLLEGVVWAVGPSKMLTFRFPKIAVAKPGAKSAPIAPATTEGVTVTVAQLRRQPEALLVTVLIENPKGSPGFESHQSWLENNRIMLYRGAGAKKLSLIPTGNREEMRGNGARVVYEFAESGEQRLPDTLDGWTLEYETPGRIVELTAPFTLKDLALP